MSKDLCVKIDEEVKEITCEMLKALKIGDYIVSKGWRINGPLQKLTIQGGDLHIKTGAFGWRSIKWVYDVEHGNV